MSGIKRIKKNKVWILIPIIYLIIVALLTGLGRGYLSTLDHPFSSDLFERIFLIFMAELGVIGIIQVLIVLGTPLSSKYDEKGLTDIKFVDKMGSPPVLVSKTKNNNGWIYEFYSPRIPLYEYETRRKDIDNALDIRIISIDQGKDMQHIKVKAISSGGSTPETINWKEEYLDNRDFILNLGKSFDGDVSVDLNLMPHMLIGGGTGSGKTILLKLILAQCIKKEAIVYIADFKGGVDFPQIWHEKCTIITDKNEFAERIVKIRKILSERQRIFHDAGARDIMQYNLKTKSGMKRIIIACDEVGELFNKSTLSKEEKIQVDRIEGTIESLASLGRAFGINLILSTQRPSVDVIDGKIKTNLSYRICGRAESTLSKIILDDTEASKVIHQSDIGMFFTNTKELFKAYYFNDSWLQ